MAIKVSATRGATKVSVNTVNTGSQRVTSASLQQLSNVDTTAGLQDGYTLVYDEDTGKWVAQELSSSVQLDVLDGGTY
jgi:hypothetical protein